tara:strand:- start:60 stop:938 length:879 start_codon:yes stop_codon:yes gene_type:complete
MKLFSLFGNVNSLYFPGCTTYFRFQQNFELYQKIFSKVGIIFKVIEKQVCSGLPALEAGYDQESRKLARRNFEIFKEEGIKNVLTNSPEDYKMFLYDYPEILPDWDINVGNIWTMILEEIKRRPKLIKYKAMEMVTYHDSCYLGRYCGIYDELREILELIGYEVKELFNSKSKSICCGSCGGLPRTNPELADKIAKEKILQAKRIGVKKIIVASMKNYELLKKNIGDSGVEVLELSEVLALALGIKIKEKKQDETEFEESEEDQIVIDLESDEKIKRELKDEPEEVAKDWEK